MTITVWRIASDTPQWTAEDLAGKGAAHNGGRWNHAGEHVTYASMSISLAAWEARAHLKGGVQLPLNRFLVRLEIPADVWKKSRRLPRRFPVGWDAIPEGRVSRQLGSAWLASGASALLVVPSVVIPEENNVLINPAHRDAGPIKAVKVRKFLYDPRV